MGEFQEAVEIIYHELSIAPSPQLYTLAGITFAKMGKYRRAIDVFNAVLESDPQNVRALYNLSVAYEKMRQFEKADRILKRAEKLRQLKEKNQ